jgi:hypothetical protein
LNDGYAMFAEDWLHVGDILRIGPDYDDVRPTEAAFTYDR